MRKNILKVIDAFQARKPAKGDSKNSCSTDGEVILSYRTVIAERLPSGLVRVAEPSSTRTTNSQIRAVREALGALVVDQCGHSDCAEHEALRAACEESRGASLTRVPRGRACR